MRASRGRKGEVPAVTSVEVIGEYQLRLSFRDGLVREIDFADHEWVGVFEPLKDPGAFAQVRVDPGCKTIVWPDELDMAPETLHGDYEPEFSVGRLIREYRKPIG